MVDHIADLEADFRAIYHLDLGDEDLTGPRFFSLARRVFAYQGVMAARWEQVQQRDAQTAPGGPLQPEPGSGGGGARVVDLAAFRATFPGLVIHTRVGE